MVREVNHEELERVIRRHYEKRIPLCIQGRTGIGKSDTVRKTAKEIAESMKLEYSERPEDINSEKHFCLIDRRVSQLEPSDLLGLPKIMENGHGGITKWIPPSWFPKTGAGIIFLDEINLAPPSIQSACYQLILDRQLGDYVLPEGYVVIGAGNKEEDRAHTFEMAKPLENRFDWVELRVPHINIWTRWAMKNGVDHRIQAFLNFRADYLFKLEENTEERAFPTPRSWWRASKLISDVEDEKEIEILVASSVGNGIAKEFIEFSRLVKKYKVEDFVRDPNRVRDITALNERWALTSALIHFFKEDEKFFRAYCKIAQLTETAWEKPEFGIVLMRNLVLRHQKYVRRVSAKIPEWKEISKTIVKYTF